MAHAPFVLMAGLTEPSYYRTETVSDPAFGRAVRQTFSIVCGFSALRAEKPHTKRSERTMLPQAKKLLCGAQWRNCVSPIYRYNEKYLAQKYGSELAEFSL
jgi:hypothetical protein